MLGSVVLCSHSALTASCFMHQVQKGSISAFCCSAKGSAVIKIKQEVEWFVCACQLVVSM